MSTPAVSDATSSVVPLPQNGSKMTPVDYVRSLPPEDKEAIFVELLREAIRLNGGKALIPVDGPGGEQLGYFVPPEVAAELAGRELPQLTADRERELRERSARANTAVPVRQVVAELREQERQLRKQ